MVRQRGICVQPAAGRYDKVLAAFPNNEKFLSLNESALVSAGA
jgi:hypothetical protein